MHGDKDYTKKTGQLGGTVEIDVMNLDISEICPKFITIKHCRFD